MYSWSTTVQVLYSRRNHSYFGFQGTLPVPGTYDEAQNIHIVIMNRPGKNKVDFASSLLSLNFLFCGN